MGEKDITQRTLESINSIFADIVNALLFDGDDVVKEGDLEDASARSQYKMAGKQHSQERDVAKWWHNTLIRAACFGFENQTLPDKDMAMRVMGYDGAAYSAQVHDKKGASHKPVITLVLYFGVDCTWNAPKTLKECLEIPKGLDSFVSDYKINVFELSFLEDNVINRFKSDFRFVVQWLRGLRGGNVEDVKPQKLLYVHEVLDTLQAISGKKNDFDLERKILDVNESKGGVTMYDFIDMGIDKGKAIGERQGIAIGERQGIDKGKSSVISVFQSLKSQGRNDDIFRAISDKQYLETLLKKEAAL